MKRFLPLLVLAIIAMSSCAPNSGHRTPDSISPVEYNGHKYIMFERYGGLAATSYSLAVLHDPDCACNPEKKSYFCAMPRSALIPMRPKDFVCGLNQEEQAGLTYYVLSGCTKREAFLTFCRPDMLASKAKAAIDDYIKQFFASKDAQSYIDAYQKTINDFLHPVQTKSEKSEASLEERKAKAKAKATEFAITMANNIEQADDPEFVLKLMDKVGILEQDEEVEVVPQRFLSERCCDCRYRAFCEQECEDMCQYCRYRKFGEENGIHYDSQHQLDLGTDIASKE